MLQSHLPDWREILPWLDGIDFRVAAFGYAHTPVVLENPPSVGARAILDYIQQELINTTLGETFPHAPPEPAVQVLRLTNRSSNALSRNGVTNIGDLLQLQLNEVVDWSNVGKMVVEDLLVSLIYVSIDAPAPEAEPAAPATWIVDLIRDVETLTEWNVLIGRGESSIFDLSDHAPPVQHEARERILQLAAVDVEASHHPPSLFDTLQYLFAQFDERDLSILTHRTFSDDTSTLDALGTTMGVTRERVRQLERRSGRVLQEELEREPLASLLPSIHKMIGTLSTFTELSNRVPEITREIPLLGVPIWRVLSVLDPAFQTDGDWCACPTIAEAKVQTSAQLVQQVNAHGAAEIADLALVEAGSPEAVESLTRQRLQQLGHITTGQHVFTRTSSVGDYAAGILSVTGEPLSSDEIIARFAFERSVRSLRNALSQDERFTRVDRDHWALTEWGLESYTTIKDLISQEVDAAGGTVSLDALVDGITSRFSVSATSVIAYANVPPFRVSRGLSASQTRPSCRRRRRRTLRVSIAVARHGCTASRSIMITSAEAGQGCLLPSHGS